MSEKPRLGTNPLDDLIKDTREKDIKKPKNRDITISQKVADEPPRFKQVREAIASGSSNYYISKDNEIIQRILIHIPFELCERLKKQAFESVPRMTLSGLIRKKLK